MLAELIPEWFFNDRSTWLLWVIAAGGIVPLVFGADFAVSKAVKLAKSMGLSTVIIGATVVSLGTTSPEAFVSVTAAFSGKPGLALGNGIGSVICDTALIFGLCCCLVRLPKDKFILKRHGWLQLGSGVLLVVVLLVLAMMRGSFYGVEIPRLIGIAFLVLLGVYLWISVVWARQHPEAIPSEAVEGKAGRGAKAISMELLGVFFGLALVVGGAQFLVGSASVICTRWGVPESVLAVTLVAFGTSLPELVTALAAIIKGHPELLVGNVIGADILNVLFVVGASATAVPLQVPVEFFYLHLPVMIMALVLLRLYIARRGDQFSRWEGVPLLLLFAGYYVALITLVSMGVLKMPG
ncbi:MAG: calcium/sodium antiporter [Phycisphaerae bacterium]|nr:calcium/sodium antiporter [Phycisphaerae bacterium]